MYPVARDLAQVLFMFGNVIKTLFAKMMSSHYYKASQFEKLQDALKKARPLSMPHVECLSCGPCANGEQKG